ncbi:MAG: zf-HC2 domain-containing protein [Candidatus Aminicenantes bacterium]|nr:zf-HC2 domain-containing protein [Candidatus Aminicenantes bacterium]MDH5465964.1 zf-HC2 domain-containing protein [Candidatus Aminicenantes bacterium]MDH5704435.1 zf-HC2 domain-containing protein [Candidatus Aminicenantes bacterium]
MNCKKVEKLILRAFDGRLTEDEKKELEAHLKQCPQCRTTQEEYQLILDTLRKEDFPEPKPYFLERLQPKLREVKKYEPWMVWKQWGMRAIPVSLLVIIFLSATLILFSPPREEVELSQAFSQSGLLLLQNQNLFQETTTLLETGGTEDKNMMVIFTSIDDKNGTRRDF